jgi:hypothetical protein
VETSLNPPPKRPSGRELAAIAATALILRIVLCVGALQRYDLSMHDLSHLRDGDSYIRVAAAMRGDESELKPFDRRVFPGYPGLIALLRSLGANQDTAALALNWLAGAAAAVLSAVVFRDRRVGWGMAVLTPSYLMYSTLAMSEPTLMAFIMGGLAAALSGHVLIGGLLLGYAGLIRPVACFAVVGCMAYAFAGKKPRRAIITGAAALAVVAAGVLALQAWRGDALEGLRMYASDDRAYGGEPLTWPFKSLIVTPLAQKTALWKVVYIWAHVAVTLFGCAVAALLIRGRGRLAKGAACNDAALPWLAWPWLWGNTLFVLCVGAHWGFHEFHRFMTPALPPLLWVLRRWIPSSRIFWAVVAALSLALGIWGVHH